MDRSLDLGRALGPRRRRVSCLDYPSESGCTLTLLGTVEELLPLAVWHAVAAHAHDDAPELRETIRTELERAAPPAGEARGLDSESADRVSGDRVSADRRSMDLGASLRRPRLRFSCLDHPSEPICTLTLIGTEDEVVPVAVWHAVRKHGYEDTPELREKVEASLREPAAGEG